MKEKLEEYIEHIKQVCNSSELTQHIEADKQIKAYELLEREPHRPYETQKAFAIDRLQEAFKACDVHTSKTAIKKSCDEKIFMAYTKYVDIKIHIAAHQSFNRFERDQEEIYEAFTYPAINTSPGSLSIKAEESRVNHHTELFCLHLLSTFVINRCNDFLLHDVLIDLLGKLDLLTRTIPVEVEMLVIDQCQKLLTQLNQLPGENISSHYTVPQLLVWGVQQGTGNTLNLSSNEVIFIFDEKKWQAIARTYQLMKKNSLTMNVFIIDRYLWETIAAAFLKVGASVGTLNLSYGFSPLIGKADLPDFGKTLKKMRVHLLNVSNNNLDTQTDVDWWKSFCLMLKNGHIQELDLSGNKLYLMTDELWDSFCQGIESTNLKFVQIDNISNSRMTMLKACLVKNSTLSWAFFQDKERPDTGITTCLSSYGYQ